MAASWLTKSKSSSQKVENSKKQSKNYAGRRTDREPGSANPDLHLAWTTARAFAKALFHVSLFHPLIN